MKEQIEEMAKDICVAEQKTNYSCTEKCKKQGICAYCKVIAEALYNAGYRKQEWISVDDGVPSEDEIRDEYGELIPFLVVEKDTKYPYRAFYDGTIWGDGLMKIRGITHWMPLPEPPKGGAE